MSAPAKDFLVRLGAAVLGALAVAPVLGAFLQETPFHRVLTRTFLGTMAIAFLARRGRLSGWRERARAIGLSGPERVERVLFGLAAAAGLVALLLLVSWVLGGRALRGEPHRLSFAAHFGRALLAGAGVALFEEALCRGYMKNAIGGPWSAILYAGAHFFRPPLATAPADGYEPLLGIQTLPALLGGWKEPRTVLAFGSLLLFGLALNRLRERTGTLYLGIGIHAGVVFGADFYRHYFDWEAAGGPWVFGGARLHDGVLGTALMAFLLLAAHRAPLPRMLRS